MPKLSLLKNWDYETGNLFTKILNYQYRRQFKQIRDLLRVGSRSLQLNRIPLNEFANV